MTYDSEWSASFAAASGIVMYFFYQCFGRVCQIRVREWIGISKINFQNWFKSMQKHFKQ